MPQVLAAGVDPNVSPSTGFNRFAGHGTGTCNGVPVSASWTFTDAGEPGDLDFATIKIGSAGPCPGLDVSGRRIGA